MPVEKSCAEKKRVVNRGEVVLEVPRSRTISLEEYIVEVSGTTEESRNFFNVLAVALPIQ
jgi:hypothetical protein